MDVEKAREAIRRLNAVSEELNDMGSDIDSMLHDYENAINSLNIGIAVGIKVPNGSILGFGLIEQYGKKNRWGLYHRANENVRMESIFDATILARSAMVIHIDYLFKALTRECKITTEKLKKATALARQMCKALGIEVKND